MNQAYKANKLKILNCFTVPMQVLRPYETRYDRNTVAALIINGMYPGHVKILNIGSGGKRHLAAQLKNKTVVDLDIAGDVDYLINLEVDPLKFQNNEFDIVVALDVLEHLDNFHEIVNKSIEIASKSVIISLPNPLNEVLNIVKNKKYNGTDENGLYSKYYGLPRKKPRDRHKWWFTIDSVVNFFEQYNKDYNLRYAVVYIDTIKRRVAKILIGENRFYRFYTSGIWVIIDKKSCPSGKV